MMIANVSWGGVLSAVVIIGLGYVCFSSFSFSFSSLFFFLKWLDADECSR